MILVFIYISSCCNKGLTPFNQNIGNLAPLLLTKSCKTGRSLSVCLPSFIQESNTKLKRKHKHQIFFFFLFFFVFVYLLKQIFSLNDLVKQKKIIDRQSAFIFSLTLDLLLEFNVLKFVFVLFSWDFLLRWSFGVIV